MTQTIDLNPFTPDVVAAPYPMHDALRDRGVYLIPGTDIYAVSRNEDVEFVLMHPREFSNIAQVDRRGLTQEQLLDIRLNGSLPGSDMPEHNHYRQLVGRQLSAHGIRKLEDQIARVIDGLIDPWIDGGEVELSKQFATPLTVHVFTELLGIQDEDIEYLKHSVDYCMEAMSGAVGMLTPERTALVQREMASFTGYLIELAHRRRDHPRDDLLTHVVTTPMPGLGDRVLTDQEIRGMLVTLLMGGTETTLNMICSGMWLLLTHPEQFEEIKNDFSLIPGFIEETLRHESPIQGLFRRCIASTEVGGVLIPEHSRVWVMYGAANRDPSRWDAPTTFDIHRADAKDHMAFGAGVHYCVGAPLARVEGRIAFEQLLSRMSNIHFAPGKNTFERGPSHVVRGFKELWLAFDKA